MAPPSCPASVIILSYNSRDLTMDCLRHFADALTTAGWQIILVDNASTDDTADAVRHSFEAVEVIVADANRGYAAGNNLGLASARGEVSILLNSDVIAAPQALTALADRLAQQPDVGAISAGLRTASGAAQAHAFGREPTLGRLLARNATRLLGRGDIERWDVDHPVSVEWVSGACLAVRAAAIAQVGLLDEQFFLYFEDVDWCRRLRDAGWQVLYDPTIAVTHLGGGSQEQTTTGSPHYNPSLIAYYRKHFSPIESRLLTWLLWGYGLLQRWRRHA